MYVVLTVARYTSVFTIHAASAETIQDSFCKIARIGGLESTENAGRHFLSQLSEPWLLIIDNADDPTLILRDLYPPGDSAHILVTTRNPDFRQEGSLGYLELKGLKEEEALQLLLTKADIPKPWDFTTIEAGNLIAKTLGYLALALIHAGNCIYRRICSIGDYLNLHSASRNMLHRRKDSDEQDEEDDMVRAIYSTFEVSRKFLLKKQTIKSRDAVALLNIVSFYHFEKIPVEIFTRGVFNRQKAAQSAKSAANSSFGARLQKAIESRLDPPKMLPRFLKDNSSQLDKYRVTRAISELQSLSLISFDGKDYTFSLHPLVHAWVRDSLSSPQKKVWASIAFNTLMESIQLPPEGDSEADGDFHRDIMPHLNSCLQVCGDPIPPLASGLGTDLLRLTKFLQPTRLIIMRDQILSGAKCGYVLATRGHFEVAAHHLQTVKDNLIQLLGVQHEKSLAAMLGLAGVLWGLGRLEEAIVLQSLVIDTRTKLYGSHHEKTLEAMDQLGRSHWLHGQYKEALVLQKITSSAARSTLGPTHPLTLAAIDNLGVTLGSWRRYKESEQAHQEVLIVRKGQLGETHLDTLTTMSNLAMALMDLGQLEEARHMMSKVHYQRQQQLGKEHPWTLWALCYLAKIFVKMGLYKEAEEMLIWGIGAGERSLGKNHLGVLVGRGELSRIYSRQGRLKEAEDLLLDTIELLEASRGLPHPDCVFARYKLARLYEIQGDVGKAIEASRLALQRADMRLTREHPLGQRLEGLLQKLLDLMPDFKAFED